jgi:hypothetical protein
MANFLTFEENQVLINNNLFPANNISLQLNANTVPVKDVYGNLLYYSPTGPIQGTIGLSFFLTGAIPSYLRLENQDETPVKIAFNRLLIPDCYLTNLSFSVKPFEPIPVRAEFVFYHGVKALSTFPLILNNESKNIPANGIAYANNLFTSGLNTLNGMSSYILTDSRSSYVENAIDFIVTDFDYQFSVERVPVLRVGDTFPLRVAMKEANGEFSITTNNIDGYLDIHGNTAEFSAVLRDNTNLNVNDTINLTGIIIDQNYEISDDNYGLSKIKMTQAINRKRSPVTIPMEVSNPNIVAPPTVNPVNPIVIPGSTVITTTIVEEEKPKPEDPNVDPNPPPEIDTTEWYYISVVVNCIMYNAQNAGGCSYMDLVSTPDFENFNSNGMKLVVMSRYYELEFDTTIFDATTNPKGNKVPTNSGEDISKQWNYSGRGPIITLKVNKEFLENLNFLSSPRYISNENNIFIKYSFKACNPLLLEEGYPPNLVEQKYSSFFRGSFFSALNDEYKNKATPYIHDITTILPNNDGSLAAVYRG